MRKADSVLEPILDAVSVRGGTVVDVGCGTGEIANALAEEGARVIGVDQAEMLSKVDNDERATRVEFLEGGAEELPIDDASVDLVLFLASLHHVPAPQIPKAVDEAYRVLKPGGHSLFIEPIVECSYYLITRLAEEETEARRLAHEAIAGAGTAGFEEQKEDFFFLERSLEDFRKLLELYPPEDEQETRTILARAEEITHTLADGAGCALADYRFHSACRLNLLRKPEL